MVFLTVGREITSNGCSVTVLTHRTRLPYFKSIIWAIYPPVIRRQKKKDRWTWMRKKERKKERGGGTRRRIRNLQNFLLHSHSHFRLRTHWAELICSTHKASLIVCSAFAPSLYFFLSHVSVLHPRLDLCSRNSPLITIPLTTFRLKKIAIFKMASACLHTAKASKYLPARLKYDRSRQWYNRGHSHSWAEVIVWEVLSLDASFPVSKYGSDFGPGWIRGKYVAESKCFAEFRVFQRSCVARTVNAENATPNV